jgi:hypothetical protein
MRTLALRAAAGAPDAGATAPTPRL